MYTKVIIKNKVAEIIRSGNPWIMSGAIIDMEEKIPDGSLVSVFDEMNNFVGNGYFNSRTNISIRVISWSDEPIDKKFFVRRISTAYSLKKIIEKSDTNAYRLINGEGDLLGGLIIDKYIDFFVLQISTCGIQSLQEVIIEALKELFNPKAVIIRNDIGARRIEGLEVPSQPTIIALREKNSEQIK